MATWLEDMEARNRRLTGQPSLAHAIAELQRRVEALEQEREAPRYAAQQARYDFDPLGR